MKYLAQLNIEPSNAWMPQATERIPLLFLWQSYAGQ